MGFCWQGLGSVLYRHPLLALQPPFALMGNQLLTPSWVSRIETLFPFMALNSISDFQQCVSALCKISLSLLYSNHMLVEPCERVD